MLQHTRPRNCAVQQCVCLLPHADRNFPVIWYGIIFVHGHCEMRARKCVIQFVRGQRNSGQTIKDFTRTRVIIYYITCGGFWWFWCAHSAAILLDKIYCSRSLNGIPRTIYIYTLVPSQHTFLQHLIVQIIANTLSGMAITIKSLNHFYDLFSFSLSVSHFIMATLGFSGQCVCVCVTLVWTFCEFSSVAFV